MITSAEADEREERWRKHEEAELAKRHEMDDWLSATGCAGDTAATVRRLLAHVSSPDERSWTDTKIVLKAEKTERR